MPEASQTDQKRLILVSGACRDIRPVVPGIHVRYRDHQGRTDPAEKLQEGFQGASGAAPRLPGGPARAASGPCSRETSSTRVGITYVFKLEVSNIMRHVYTV